MVGGGGESEEGDAVDGGGAGGGHGLGCGCGLLGVGVSLGVFDGVWTGGVVRLWLCRGRWMEYHLRIYSYSGSQGWLLLGSPTRSVAENGDELSMRCRMIGQRSLKAKPRQRGGKRTGPCKWFSAPGLRASIDELVVVAVHWRFGQNTT